MTRGGPQRSYGTQERTARSGLPVCSACLSSIRSEHGSRPMQYVFLVGLEKDRTNSAGPAEQMDDPRDVHLELHARRRRSPQNFHRGVGWLRANNQRLSTELA